MEIIALRSSWLEFKDQPFKRALLCKHAPLRLFVSPPLRTKPFCQEKATCQRVASFCHVWSTNFWFIVFQLIINLKCKYYIPTMWLRNLGTLVDHSGKRDSLLLGLLIACWLYTPLCGEEASGNFRETFSVPCYHQYIMVSLFSLPIQKGCNDTTLVSGKINDQEDN